jgi:two-component system, LytTR family, response regulator
MLRAIAIDDEPKALEIIVLYATKVPFIDLKDTFVDAFEAMAYLQNEAIDLIFLDIKMPDISGLEFLRTLTRPPLVIFTTGYSDYAVQSYDYNAIDYLLKVFTLERFLKACNKAYDNWKTQQPQDSPPTNYIFIKNGGEQQRVLYEDILYLEAGGNYVVFVTKTQKIVSRLTMTEAEALLPTSYFVRIHRSYIVARNKIEKYDKYDVTIQNVTIPIGENFRQQTPLQI